VPHTVPSSASTTACARATAEFRSAAVVGSSATVCWAAASTMSAGRPQSESSLAPATACDVPISAVSRSPSRAGVASSASCHLAMIDPNSSGRDVASTSCPTSCSRPAVKEAFAQSVPAESRLANRAVSTEWVFMASIQAADRFTFSAKASTMSCIITSPRTVLVPSSATAWLTSPSCRPVV